MKAHAYLRVSTDEQSNGIAAQRAAIEAWAKREGRTIVSWHTDEGVSGGAPIDERPGLVGCLSSLESGDVLVVARRDRLARDVLIAVTAERLALSQGASIASADGAPVGDSPEAVMMRGMLDLFAQYERAVIRARTKAALAAKKRRGERTGGIPYGFKVVPGEPPRLTEDTKEQNIIRYVKTLRAGKLGLRKICSHLDRVGYRTRTGTGWKPQQIKRMLGP